MKGLFYHGHFLLNSWNEKSGKYLTWERVRWPKDSSFFLVGTPFLTFFPPTQRFPDVKTCTLIGAGLEVLALSGLFITDTKPMENIIEIFTRYTLSSRLWPKPQTNRSTWKTWGYSSPCHTKKSGMNLTAQTHCLRELHSTHLKPLPSFSQQHLWAFPHCSEWPESVIDWFESYFVYPWGQDPETTWRAPT